MAAIVVAVDFGGKFEKITREDDFSGKRRFVNVRQKARMHFKTFLKFFSQENKNFHDEN